MNELKQRVNQWLFQMIGSDELVESWWITPNRWWNGTKPYEVWKHDPQQVIDYLKKFLK